MEESQLPIERTSKGAFGPTTHLAMTSDIALAATCGWKYRLLRIFGVPYKGSFGGLVGIVVHDILARSGGAIHETWQRAPSGSYLTWLSEKTALIKAEVFSEWTEKFEQGSHTIEELFELAERRFDSMLEGISRLMVEKKAPSRFLTELQISNPGTGHEGRLDALAEWDDGRYATIDYKTNTDEAPQSHGYDHYQIVANGMLANYRNNLPEDDFNRNELLILYPGGCYHPHPTPKVQTIVREARDYVLSAVSSASAAAADAIRELSVPKACWICQRPEECGYYRSLEGMHREGTLPSDQEELRRLVWQRRYKVLDYRQISHRWKFMVAANSLEELERLRIVETGYTIQGMDKKGGLAVLSRRGGTRVFLKGDPVQIVALEKGRPILSCMNFRGAIHGVITDGIEVKIGSHNLAEVGRLAGDQSLMAMRSEVDLTKSELQSLDFIQRRASPAVIQMARAFLGVT